MKNIDFLPDNYRKRDALRRARLWWGIVVIVFGFAISSAAVSQGLLKRSIQRELADIQPQYVAAQQRVQELTQLQAQISSASRSARLVTWLRHPWPRSQILAEIVRPLPPGIRITEMRIADEAAERKTPQSAGPRRRGAKRDEDDRPKLAAAEADLDRLRTEAAASRTVVQITGETGDVAAIHELVSDIGESSLFATVHLTSLETVIDARQHSKTTFSIRIVVRPTHGQSDGEPPASEQPMAATKAGMPGRNRLALGGERP